MQEGPIRRWLRSRGFLGEVAGATTTTTTDQQVEEMTRAKVAQWKAMGLTETQINMALRLAENWARSMTNFASGGDPSIADKIYPAMYRRGLDTVATDWINAMMIG